MQFLREIVTPYLHRQLRSLLQRDVCKLTADASKSRLKEPVSFPFYGI